MNEVRKDDIESYRFNPLGRGNLWGRVYLKGQLDQRGEYFGLKEKIDGLEFQTLGALDTKSGGWGIYGRFNHQIPEFPEGGDKYNSALGLYYSKDLPEVCQQIVLQHSLAPINRARFADTLKNVSGYYLERPLIKGLTSKVNTINPLFVGATGLIVGGIIGGFEIQIIPYESIPNEKLMLPLVKGMIIGAYGGMGLSFPLNFAGELSARLHIKDKSELIVGGEAKRVLDLEYEHLFEVLNQREIYSAIEEETSSGVMVNLRAGDFLWRVYRRLDLELNRARMRELEQERGLRRDEMAPRIKNALPRLISAARDIVNEDRPLFSLKSAGQAR